MQMIRVTDSKCDIKSIRAHANGQLWDGPSHHRPSWGVLAHAQCVYS